MRACSSEASMRDDEMMDEILRAAMSAPPPTLPSAFEQDVQRRTAPRRLTPGARVVMWSYTAVSVALCVWGMLDLPVALSAVAIVSQAIVAVGLWGYTRHLARAGRTV
jgi:hypothetical protein